MNETLLFTVLILCAIGVVSALILYFVAKKFFVYEDPRIDSVEKMLPGANCGGCGFPGCRGLASALVGAESLEKLNCPVGGSATMGSIATFLGKAAVVKEPEVAVVRCAGSCSNRPKISKYDGAPNCSIASGLYAGETACSFGCLGFGDCVTACAFDAIHINEQTQLPEVDETKCTACGKCVTACPKFIIELRRKGIKSRRIFVSCVSKDKGGVSRKACTVSCIGCGKCVKACAFEAITLENNLAYIDSNKCKLCRKCAAECPTGAILEINFPPKVVKPAEVAKKVTDNPELKPATENNKDEVSVEEKNL